MRYQLCCFYAQRPERYFPCTFHDKDESIQPKEYYIPSPFAFRELRKYHHEDVVNPKVYLQELANPIDATKSVRGIPINHESFPYTAMNFLFFYKYKFHMYMEALIIISRFLNNQDCLTEIGEYLGLEKDWIVYDRNHYKKQAYEVL